MNKYNNFYPEKEETPKARVKARRPGGGYSNNPGERKWLLSLG